MGEIIVDEIKRIAYFNSFDQFDSVLARLPQINFKNKLIKELVLDPMWEIFPQKNYVHKDDLFIYSSEYIGHNEYEIYVQYFYDRKDPHTTDEFFRKYKSKEIIHDGVFFKAENGQFMLFYDKFED